MDHSSSRAYHLNMPVEPPPVPWRAIGAFAVGGLAEVGFAEGTDLLLVVSSTGRGVFDCRKGERVARDYAEPDDTWYDCIRLTAQGIGPIEGQTVRLAGMSGGGLPLVASDGWLAEMAYPNWPGGILLLKFFDGVETETKLVEVDVPRACGFSETGRTLIAAASHTLYDFGRD